MDCWNLEDVISMTLSLVCFYMSFSELLKIVQNEKNKKLLIFRRHKEVVPLLRLMFSSTRDIISTVNTMKNSLDRNDVMMVLSFIYFFLFFVRLIKIFQSEKIKKIKRYGCVVMHQTALRRRQHRRQ